MRVVTNPGSNLSAKQLAHYQVILTPQQIVADGVTYLTKTMSSVEEVDRIVAQSKTHPHVLGTSAAEFVSLFHEVGPHDPEIIVTTTSRKLIGSYDAAIAAARTLQTLPAFRNVQIGVVDTTLVDAGAGYVTMFCAESAKMGKPMREIVDAAKRLGAAGRLFVIPSSLDYLVKGGRASFLRSMAATLLQKLPIIALKDGELKSAGTVSKSANRVEAIANMLTAEVPAGTTVFAGVVQAHHKSEAEELMALLRKRYDVRYSAIQEWSPAVYLNCGPNFGAFIIPLDAAPYRADIAC